MTNYNPSNTAILLMDPYNDFLSEGGKLYNAISKISEEVNLIQNLKNITQTAREAGMTVFIVPHKRWEPSDYKNWKHPNPTQKTIMEKHSFAKGEWGGEWHPELVPQENDIIVKEHWAQNGFANTDLSFLLKQHDISHVIIIGLLANSCVEGTARFAMELGYHVTLVKDATAAYSKELMHAAHELNGPTYAHSIQNSAEIITKIQSK